MNLALPSLRRDLDASTSGLQWTIDAYTLVICPLVLGRGKRLFEPGAERDLTLIDSRTATTGAIVTSYEVTR